MRRDLTIPVKHHLSVAIPILLILLLTGCSRMTAPVPPDYSRAKLLAAPETLNTEQVIQRLTLKDESSTEPPPPG